MNDIIEHHGVKGQKWGVVKKDDSQNGVRTTSPKSKLEVAKGYLSDHKKQIAIGAAVGIGIAAVGYGLYSGKIPVSEDLKYKMTLAMKSPLDGNKIAKGKTVFRANHGKMTLDNARTYFSPLKKDHLTYLTNPGGTNIGKGEMLSVSLKAKEQINSPSSRRMAKEFVSFTKEHPDIVARSISDKYNLGKYVSKEAIEKETPEILKNIKGLSKSDLTKRTQQDFLLSIVNPSRGAYGNEGAKEFYSYLSKKGFNAMNDIEDTGWTKKPMVAFDALKSFDITSQLPLKEAIKKYG